jgi:ComF family protein
MPLPESLHRLLPTVCVFCAQPWHASRICSGCLADLPQLGAVCSSCCEPLPADPEGPLDCARCQQRPPPWSACAAALPYEWPVDSALKALKFRGQLVYAAAFAELLLPIVNAHFAEIDALCPVPLHRWRQARRGFNQAMELCRPLAYRLRLPVSSNLRRVRATKPQSGLGRIARRRNLREAFAISGPLRCRYPLLVDDIMTTGETCWQLSELLLENGAERVAVLTVARAASGYGRPG